tara:strand:- start:366 stop:812 length:447 start_codon:yes stop_codon:yes gene_type:complete
MNKKQVLEKLEKLEELILETDVDQEKVKDRMWLFSKNLVDNKTNMMMVDEERVTTRDLIEIMKKSNIMWNLRNRILEGDDVYTPMYELESEMMDFIQNNQKIAAIKLYRKTMKDDFNIEVTLKTSKELVDSMANGVPLQVASHGIQVK